MKPHETISSFCRYVLSKRAAFPRECYVECSFLCVLSKTHSPSARVPHGNTVRGDTTTIPYAMLHATCDELTLTVRKRSVRQAGGSVCGEAQRERGDLQDAALDERLERVGLIAHARALRAVRPAQARVNRSSEPVIQDQGLASQGIEQDASQHAMGGRGFIRSGAQTHQIFALTRCKARRASWAMEASGGRGGGGRR